MPKSNEIRVVTPNGVMTVNEASQHYDISYSTLLERHKRGLGGSALVRQPCAKQSAVARKGAATIDIEGKRYTFDTASRAFRIPLATLTQRYRRGLRGSDLVTKRLVDTITTKEGVFTRREASEYYGIPLNTIHRRIFIGLSGDDVVRPAQRNGVLVNYAGYEFLIIDLADTKRESIVWRYRLQRGWSVEETLETPISIGPKKNYISAYGVVSLSKIAEYARTTERTLKQRLDNGWTEDQAFNTPSYGERGSHFILPPLIYESMREHHSKLYGVLQTEHLEALTKRVIRVGIKKD